MFTFIILLLSTVATIAQNSIDELFDKYKSVGDTKFTSVIERDPDTHEVVKVVKMIESDMISAKTFIKTFEKEEAQATSANKTTQNNITSHVLVFETEKQIRIYSLRYNSTNKYSSINASIILKYIKH